MEPDYSKLPTRFARGILLAGGISGIVELQEDGYVAKSPWPGEEEAQSRLDIQLAAKVYQRLHAHFGNHDRFVRIKSFDEDACVLEMDYMRNGTLRDYLRAHPKSATYAQRCQWALAAAQGLVLLHSVGIVHCDFTPKNMLLNESLELKVADFGCSSVDGAASSGGGDIPSYPSPNIPSTWEAQHDVFALGSTIYEIFTGLRPYHDLPSRRVMDLVREREIPDLNGVPMASIISSCWLGRSNGASAVHSEIVDFMEVK